MGEMEERAACAGASQAVLRQGKHAGLMQSTRLKRVWCERAGGQTAKEGCYMFSIQPTERAFRRTNGGWQDEVTVPSERRAQAEKEKSRENKPLALAAKSPKIAVSRLVISRAAEQDFERSH